jgi:hypothetical protein
MVHTLMTARPILGVLTLAVLLAAGPAAAFQAEVARYHAAVADICQTGVTPVIQSAYEHAYQAVERARYGSGRDNNFWGLKSPEAFRLDCFQGVDGKT